ncbi:MAG: transglycosylase domain-containing protein [Carbonactinosporaceae bacterium]
MPGNRLPSEFAPIRQVATFLGVSALAGVLAAGLAVPVVGSVGAGAQTAAESFQQLPADLEVPQLPERSRVLATDGTTLATFYQQDRVNVPLEQVAPVMRRAIVAIEDSRFFRHQGVDPRGVLRALVTNTQSGSASQGASTLTMQYVENVSIALAGDDEDKLRAAQEEDFSSKLQEMRYALEIEDRLPKKKILENYLNIAYFGDGSYGVEAASRHYFHTTAARLTLPQAAVLAGLVRSPTAYNPVDYPGESTERRNVVISRMADLGMISAKRAERASGSRLKLDLRRTPNGCVDAASGFFCQYVRRAILTSPEFGKTYEDRKRLLELGGLTIKTTLRPAMQRAAKGAVSSHVNPRDKVASAIAMIEPGSGKIRAIASSKRYGEGKGKTNVNYAVDERYGASGGFQAGSTFKAFVAAAALAQDIPADHQINAPYQIDLDEPFKTCEGVSSARWEPSNELESENGTYTMSRAIALSVNTYFAQLEQETGLCAPVRLASRLGVTAATGDPLQEVKSFTLGVASVSPLTMAEAYATFAARGVHCDPVAITSVTGRGGKQLAVPKAHCKRVLRPEVADTVNWLLERVIDGPDASRTGAGLSIGRQAAGKTGTTNNRVSVWFIGHTPNLAAAVWAGHPDNNSYSLTNVEIGGQYYDEVCGGCLPGPIWQQAMSEALSGVPVESFVAPPYRMLWGADGPPRPKRPEIPEDAQDIIDDIFTEPPKGPGPPGHGKKPWKHGEGGHGD